MREARAGAPGRPVLPRFKKIGSRGPVSSNEAAWRAVRLVFVVTNPLLALVAGVTVFAVSRVRRRVRGWWLVLGAGAVWLGVAQLGWVVRYVEPYRALGSAALDGGAVDARGAVVETVRTSWVQWIGDQSVMAVVWGVMVAGVVVWHRSRYTAEWREKPTTASARQVRRARERVADESARVGAESVADLELVLGVEEVTGDVVTVAASVLRGHGVVSGPTGSGKTETLLRIADELLATPAAAALMLPFVLVDMKADPDVVVGLRAIGEATERTVKVVTVHAGEAGTCTYNPMASGSPAQWRTKLIDAEDQAADGGFESTHYKRIGERFLLLVCEVIADLVAHGRMMRERPTSKPRPWRRDLPDLVRLMNLEKLGQLVDQLSPRVATRVTEYLAEAKTSIDPKDLNGLRTRYANMVEGPAGQILISTPGGVDLYESIRRGDIVVFSLDEALDSATARQIGNMVLRDLIFTFARLGRERYGKLGGLAPVVVDEFTALGGTLLGQMYARARGAGGAVLLATQDLYADLDAVSPEFRSAVLTNSNVMVLHRQENDAAASMAEGLGTRQTWQETLQVIDDGDVFGVQTAASGTGSLRETREFIVHPDEFKALTVGEAYVVVKSPERSIRRTRIALAPNREADDGDVYAEVPLDDPAAVTVDPWLAAGQEVSSTPSVISTPVPMRSPAMSRAKAPVADHVEDDVHDDWDAPLGPEPD